ncbi:hypothetical protein Y032_0009g482 [Ancylostoma ceylanicum]|uniref:Uncharacterized protein n=1 Tax=Ancylostoma ceylanicum TaxID=53326 RepID=A0A016VIF3_9BILA|nr:hypothetical protein Y032_0009g482 [Ancylostoma ceylanicum]
MEAGSRSSSCEDQLLLIAKKCRKVPLFNPLKRRHQLLRFRAHPEQSAAAVANKRKRLKLQPRIIPLEGIDDNSVTLKVEIPRPAASSTQNQSQLPSRSPVKQPYRSSSPLKPAKRDMVLQPAKRDLPSSAPPVTNPRERNRPSCFRDLLKPEDFIPPRRVVPPPYPKRVPLRDPMNPSRTIYAYAFPSTCPKESSGNVSPSWEAYYPEGDCKKWDTGLEDTTGIDGLFFEQTPPARGADSSTDSRYEPVRYPYIGHGYDCHNYAALPPPFPVLAGTTWEYYEHPVAGYAQPFIGHYPTAPACRPPRNQRPRNVPWDIHFHDYHLPPPPPPPPEVAEPELPCASIPPPPPPLP